MHLDVLCTSTGHLPVSRFRAPTGGGPGTRPEPPAAAATPASTAPTLAPDQSTAAPAPAHTDDPEPEVDAEPAPIEPLERSFVPRFRDEVAFVPVADEGLLYVEQTGTLHQLDAIGAVICRVFDGNTSIELAAEHLADAFDAPRERVEADVRSFAERLGGYGLLAGIEVEDDAVPGED